MSYIGNTLQTAFPSYLNIDDISGSFDGVTTSFALTVGGSAPVPAPASSNQCLISVGGVIQRPDDTGTEGFRLNSGNIVFSSAPGTGEDFFGVVLAGADYLNVGVNYPSGTAAAPSITFDTDLDTGIYNPGANEIGLTTAGVNRVTIDSSGNVDIVNDLTVDTNTLYVDSTNNRVGIGTTSPVELLDIRSASNPGIAVVYTGVGDAYFYRNNAGALIRSSSGSSTNRNIAFETSDGTTPQERARIDSSGRLLVGTSSARSNVYYGTSQITPAHQYEFNTSSFNSGISLLNYGNGYPSIISLGYSNSTTQGTNALVTNGSDLGIINFVGNDGTNFRTGATITGTVDGAPSSGDMPGRLVFSTTADGASSPTERMRITQAGGVRLPDVYNQTIALSANVFIDSDGTLKRATSSIKYKTDVETLQDSYADAILNCRPVWYRSTNESDNPTWGWWGFIAEEVAEIDPRLVQWKTVEQVINEDGSRDTVPLETPEPENVAYDRFVPHLLNLIKRQKEQIEAMEARLSALEGA